MSTYRHPSERIRAINYDSFTEALDASVVEEAVAQYSHGSGLSYRIVTLVGVIGVIMSVLIPLIEVGFTDMSRFGMVAGIVLSVAVLIMAGVFLQVFFRRRTVAKLYRFARANGLTFTLDKEVPTYGGTVFKQGTERLVTEALSLEDSIEVGNYQYVVGEGRDRHTYRYGYARVQLSRSVPHMLLDGQRNNIAGVFARLPVRPKVSQKLQLEGDFSEHFTLYALKKYRQDALYIFTPDVMATLIDEAGEFDVEIIGNELFVYSVRPLKLTSAKRLQAILKAAARVGAQVEEQARHYGGSTQPLEVSNQLNRARLRGGVHVRQWVIGVAIVALMIVAAAVLLGTDAVEQGVNYMVLLAIWMTLATVLWLGVYGDHRR